jgi:hypothetical protein
MRNVEGLMLSLNESSDAQKIDSRINLGDIADQTELSMEHTHDIAENIALMAERMGAVRE